MAVSMIDVMVVMIAFTICFAIAEIAKWHVRMNCLDNPEIIWIWLEEDNEPQGGCRVRNEKGDKQICMRQSPVPCASAAGS